MPQENIIASERNGYIEQSQCGEGNIADALFAIASELSIIGKVLADMHSLEKKKVM